MTHQTKRLLSLSLCILALATNNSYAIHTTNRYFPFLDRPEMFITNTKSKTKSVFGVSPFITLASTANRRGGGKSGIPELWGMYDLHDVINSVKNVQDSSFDPITSLNYPQAWQDTSMKFKVESKVRSQGVILNYDYNLKLFGLSVGAWIPMIHITTTSKYSFNFNDFNYDAKLKYSNPARQTVSPAGENMELQVDEIRRVTHDKLGFTNGWETGGVGDLDLHLRWNHLIDHQLRMKAINLCAQIGALVPTGFKQNNFNPTSVSVMGGGHWGLYFDAMAEFELKQDWKLGLAVSDLQLLKKTETRRIPFYTEPAPFSALVGKVEIDPGYILKISPYFTLCNLTDGLNFQARYTYLRHSTDKWKDKRNNSTIKSYLTLDTSTDVINGTKTIYLAQADIDNNARVKKDWTKWREHFVTFQVVYDTKEGLQNIRTDPTFYAAWDIPINGNGTCNTNQLTVGVDLHF